MKRLILHAAVLPVLVLALAACDPKGPPPPTPKTAPEAPATVPR